MIQFPRIQRADIVGKVFEVGAGSIANATTSYSRSLDLRSWQARSLDKQRNAGLAEYAVMFVSNVDDLVQLDPQNLIDKELEMIGATHIPVTVFANLVNYIINQNRLKSLVAHTFPLANIKRSRFFFHN